MSAALRIFVDVIAFRVRRLEMANLAGAIAIMLVLRLPWPDALLRTIFALLLNVLVYLNNDYLDVALDAGTPDKDARKVAFLQAHMATARHLQWGLVAVLALLGASSPGLWLALVLGGGTCVAYSARLKHVPGLDVLAMAVWGFAMPLSGAPVDRALGLLLALQLGLMSGVFESIQVIRDYEADRAAGVRTTAVALGPQRTLWLARALMIVSAAYAACVLHPVAGLIAAVAVLVPLRAGRVDAYWTSVKLVSGIAWLVTCVLVFFHGKSLGLLFSIDARATLEALTSWL